MWLKKAIGKKGILNAGTRGSEFKTGLLKAFGKRRYMPSQLNYLKQILRNIYRHEE